MVRDFCYRCLFHGLPLDTNVCLTLFLWDTGRPFPLKGRYYANIFIHFEPTGRPLHRPADYVEEVYEDLPPYVIEGSPEEANWRRSHPKGWKAPGPSSLVLEEDKSEGHEAAQTGDLEWLTKLAQTDQGKALHHKDSNGWQPIHEAARAGHTEAVKFLIEFGVDINARTHGGKGGSPLNVAISALSKNHPVAKLLMDQGALNIEPEL